MGLIRIFLALSVVIWHAGGFKGWLPFNGSACVLLFFIISGFYMALILNEKYIGPGANLVFWKNRFFRLWPAFLIATLLAIALNPATIAGIFDRGNAFSIVALLIPNFTMVGYEIYNLSCLDQAGNFALCADGGPSALRDVAAVPQAWSLGLEIWFYLLAPFVVKSIGRTLLWLLAGLMFFVAARIAGLNLIWQYGSFPPVLLFFMLGVLSYHLQALIPTRHVGLYRTAGIALLPVVLVLIAFPGVMLPVLAQPYHYKAFALLFTLFIPAWFMWSKDKAWDRIIGETSYAIYVIHLVVIDVLIHILGRTEWLTPLAALGALLSGLLLFAIVERPIDRMRQRAVVEIRGKPAAA